MHTLQRLYLDDAAYVLLVTFAMSDILAQGYEKAGEYDHMLATIKWGTDYLIKCDLGGKAVVAQVGLGKQDHSFWR